MAVQKKKKSSARSLAIGRFAKKSNGMKSKKKTTVRKRTSTNKKNANAKDEQLEKVRDILFGEQTMESQMQLARLETRLRKDSAAFQREVFKRLSSLEAHVKSEASLRSKSVRDEKVERAAAIDDLSKQLDKIAKSLKKKISETEQRNVNSIQALRKRLTAQSQRMRELIAEATDELDDARESAIEELQAKMVDRQALAEVLSKLAASLKKP